MTSHKRTRSQAFHPSQDVQLGRDVEGASESKEAEDGEQPKEADVWETLKGEQYEAVEQLPLTLHRQLQLIRQLDERMQSYSSRLLPALESYISLRKRLARSSSTPQAQPGSANGPFVDEAEADVRHHEDQARPDTSQDTHPKNSRNRLSNIVGISEELVRVSIEKVSVAQAAYDSIERHIRLIDQSIKEQEMSLGSNYGNTSVPIVLPDLVVPKWSRSTRVVSSPIEGDDSESPALDAAPVGIPVYTEDIAQNQVHAQRKGKRARGKKSLKITLPAQNQASAYTLNPDDRLYCFCKRVSFGKMIGCDNEDCTYEWFHYECVDLHETPTGKWYCSECTNKASKDHRNRNHPG